MFKVALACLLCFAATKARPEIWGYLDEYGKPHVATRKLDDRYQLFFKGKSSADVATTDGPVTVPADEVFRQSPIYQRVTNHPNVRRFERLIGEQARLHNIDPALVKAVIAVESAFDPDAVSPKGALGLMQVMPATAQRYGVAEDPKRTIEMKLVDPAINVRTGTRYLRDLMMMFDDDVSLALAAYNAGEHAVQRHNNRVPPYRETQEFVKLVQQFYALYRPPPPPLPEKPSRITIPSRRVAH